MTVKELRDFLNQFENTIMDRAQVIIFDTTHTDNPVGIKIDNLWAYTGINIVTISASAKPDIIIKTKEDDEDGNDD